MLNFLKSVWVNKTHFIVLSLLIVIIVWKKPPYLQNKQTTSWLVRLQIFIHLLWTKIVRTHQPWSNLYFLYLRNIPHLHNDN